MTPLKTKGTPTSLEAPPFKYLRVTLRVRDTFHPIPKHFLLPVAASEQAICVYI